MGFTKEEIKDIVKETLEYQISKIDLLPFTSDSKLIVHVTFRESFPKEQLLSVTQNIKKIFTDGLGLGKGQFVVIPHFPHSEFDVEVTVVKDD